MKKVLMGLIVLLLVVGCSEKEVSKSLTEAKKQGIVIGLDDTFAPMGYRNENNELVGFDVELAQEVGELLSVEVSFQPIDWQMKELELSSGNIDCIWNGLTITANRQEKMLFTDPYLENSQIIIALNDSKELFDDWKGKVIAVQKDSSAAETLQNYPNFIANNEVIELSTNLECFLSLDLNKVDALVCDEVLGRYVLNQRTNDYVVLNEQLSVEEYGVAFRLDDHELAQAVNEAIKQLQENGKFAEIYQKYFKV